MKIALISLLMIGRASAQPIDDEDALQLHGWASQGAMLSTGNNYLAMTKRGSFEFFEAGLNVTKEIGSDLRAGVQIFAQDLGPIGNYQPIVDFAYVDYRVKPYFGVRAGHFKMPLFLYSDRLDADMTRTTVLMPQAVYDQRYRDVLAAVSGVDAYGTVELGAGGSLDYDAYVGTLFISPRGSDYDVENLAGTRVVWNTPVPCLRIGGHALYGNFHETNSATGMVLKTDYNDWTMTGGALECATEKLVLTAEVSRWHSNLSLDPTLMAPPIDYDEWRAYAQAELHATDRLGVAAYASAYRSYTGGANVHEDANHQYDGAVSARFDVTPNFLVKAEVHSIQGYGETQNALNDGAARASRWSLFLLKTTLSF